MDCIIQVFPDEYHLQTLETLLGACPQLQVGNVISTPFIRTNIFSLYLCNLHGHFCMVKSFISLSSKYLLSKGLLLLACSFLRQDMIL